MAQNPNAVISEGITNVYSEATQKFVGKSIMPDVRGAINLSLGYKGFSLGAQMLYGLGGYAYDYTYAGLMANNQVGSGNYHEDLKNAWTTPGQQTNIPRQSSGYTNSAAAINDGQQTSRSTRFLTKADYLLLNNVSLGYEFSKDVLDGTGITGLSLSLSANNLFLATARSGFNPLLSETGASDTYKYSPISNFTFGVKVKF